MTTFLDQLNDLSPEGYNFALHIRFAKPLLHYSTYPKAWRDLYKSQNYGLRDPTAFWAIANSGAIRWSEVTLPDPFGVLEKARQHGLAFGVTITSGQITARTGVGLMSGKREFTDDEVARAVSIAEELHRIGEPVEGLPREVDEARCYDAIGFTPEAAAREIGTTVDVFRARLSQAEKAMEGRAIGGAPGMA